jgi:hypothetical protein
MKQCKFLIASWLKTVLQLVLETTGDDWEDEPGKGVYNLPVHSQQTFAVMHIISSPFLCVPPWTHPSVHMKFNNDEHFTKISRVFG